MTHNSIRVWVKTIKSLKKVISSNGSYKFTLFWIFQLPRGGGLVVRCSVAVAGDRIDADVAEKLA